VIDAVPHPDAAEKQPGLHLLAATKPDAPAIESLRSLYMESSQAADQAKAAVAANSEALRRKLEERQALLSKLDQAKLQEQVNKAMTTLSESVGQDAPSFEEVRQKIDARYATVFFATLTPDGLLTYCNAGHNPPIVVGPSGVRSLESGSVPVGLFSSATYTDAETKLEQGDVLIIYSDGVTEALNTAGEEFSDARLAEQAIQHRTAPLGDLLQSIITAVQTFAAGAQQSDDVTVLVARYLGPGNGIAPGA